SSSDISGWCPWPLPFPLPFPKSCDGTAPPLGAAFRNPLKRRRTSADAVGLRASLPLKSTSSIRSPRRLFALCSPITQVMASATLLLPHPFGPTIAVTPRSNASSDRSENDLNPLISRRSRRMDTPRRQARRTCGENRSHCRQHIVQPQRLHTSSAAGGPAVRGALGVVLWLDGRKARARGRPSAAVWQAAPGRQRGRQSNKA